jgi:hypothetical protein
MAKQIADSHQMGSIIAYEEADSQLRFHPMTGALASWVISGDSDMLELGHTKVIMVKSYNKDSYRVFDLSALDIKLDDPLPPRHENSKDLDVARHLMALGYAHMNTSLLRYHAA